MRQMKLIIAALLVAAPMAANADLITYDWSGTSAEGWSGTGAVVFDEADLVTGVNVIDSLISFIFEWTDGVGDFSVSHLDSLVSAATGDSWFVNADLSLSSLQFCTDACSSAGHPEFFVTTSGAWDATNGVTQISGTGSGAWSEARRISVPEPGSLALLGLGLAVMGLARRRRKV